MVSHKFCYICGSKVNLRRDNPLSASFVAKAHIINPQYRFVHKKCEPELDRQTRIPFGFKEFRLAGVA